MYRASCTVYYLDQQMHHIYQQYQKYLRYIKYSLCVLYVYVVRLLVWIVKFLIYIYRKAEMSDGGGVCFN